MKRLFLASALFLLIQVFAPKEIFAQEGPGTYQCYWLPLEDGGRCVPLISNCNEGFRTGSQCHGLSQEECDTAGSFICLAETPASPNTCECSIGSSGVCSITVNNCDIPGLVTCYSNCTMCSCSGSPPETSIVEPDNSCTCKYYVLPADPLQPLSGAGRGYWGVDSDNCLSGSTAECSSEGSCSCVAEEADIFCDGDTGINTAIGCIPIGDTNEFIGFFLRWAIGIGGGIAFLLILFAGFQIMTCSGNPERLKAGQELLTSAIAGLILLIFSVFILKLIGVNILRLPGFGGG